MAGVPVVTSTTGRYGHVAYVESVNANGTINISEMNFEGLGKKSFRTIDGDSVAGYIYPKE
jgi:surface antigen